MNVRIGVIDYSIGNLFSVIQALTKVGFNAEIIEEPEKLREFDGLVLPGVGAFKTAMDNLHKTGLKEAILNYTTSGKPLMGVCLGMQLMLDSSEEFGETQGLGLISGRVKSFRKNLTMNLPVPKISWDNLEKLDLKWDHTPLESTQVKDDLYFVHSYYCDVSNTSEILSLSKYGNISYASSILKDNLFATQFHPEKSGEVGLKIYSNWKKNQF